MPRPMRVLIAAAITVSTFAGASAANAATVPSDPASLTHAATDARTAAGAALGGISIPSASAARLRAASASTKPLVLPLNATMTVKVHAKRYDLHVVSAGSKSDLTHIRLFLAGQSADISVRRLVRLTVTRHGYKHPLMETTTTFRRFVVMETGLESNPLLATRTHFATRSDFLAALTHGLAISSAEVTKEYGAQLRFAQMSLDLASTLLAAAEYAISDPTATDFSAVPTVQTTAGSGGYAGTVTLTGSLTDFSVTATNTTDGSSLTEAASAQSISITYTVGGKTYTFSA